MYYLSSHELTQTQREGDGRDDCVSVGCRGWVRLGEVWLGEVGLVWVRGVKRVTSESKVAGVWVSCHVELWVGFLGVCASSHVVICSCSARR